MTSSRRSQARAARRTACRSRWRSSRSSRRSAPSASATRTAPTTGRVADTFPASDPTTEQQPAGEPLPDDAPVLTAAHEGHHRVPVEGADYELDHGSVVITAITSCTNTSNPQVMVAAGLLARNAIERGLQRKPWVKSSLAPGSKVVTRYYEQAGLQTYLDAARFQHRRVRVHDVHRQLGAARRRDLDCDQRRRPRRLLGALGQPQLRGAHPPGGEGELPGLAAARRCLRARGANGHRLRDRADRCSERRQATSTCATSGRARARSARRSRRLFEPSSSPRPTTTSSPATTPGGRSPCPKDSSSGGSRTRRTFDSPRTSKECRVSPGTVSDIADACVLVWLGDSVTTDHISPAGSIKEGSPAGTYLVEHGVSRKDFNSYGARRGNHEVMVRGTFANVRLRNKLVPGSEGTWTVHVPSGEEMTIFDASPRYLAEGMPLIVLAGKEYGSGSSRDWAAKGPNLLGVRAVIAEIVRTHPPLEPPDDGDPPVAIRGRRVAGVARAHRP